MGLGPGLVGKQGGHAVSFLLGAALPTALLFFLASDRLGEGLSTISTSWRGNNAAVTVAQQASSGPAAANQPAATTDAALAAAAAAGSDDRAAPNTTTQAGHEQQQQVDQFAGLAELLARVATEDRTVIMTSVNEVWTRPDSLLDIFLGGFRDGEDTAHLVDHILIVTVDAASFAGCKAAHPHCYLLELAGMDMNRAKSFGSPEYVEMIWHKLSIQQRVLELGYNFLFTDADILWLRNPFRRISVYADMSCSVDNSKMAPALLDCESNVGFYYVKATRRSVEMLRYWRAARGRFEGNPIEQVVFNRIKRELVDGLGARIQPLETEYVSGFCDFQDHLDAVCTVHANCCMGLENKVHDLRSVARDWKNYTGMTTEQRKEAAAGSFKVTPPRWCQKSMGWV